MTNYSNDLLRKLKQGTVVKIKDHDVYGHIVGFDRVVSTGKLMLNVLWAGAKFPIRENIEDLEII